MDHQVRTFTAADFRAHAQDFLGIAADVAGEYWRDQHFLMDLPDKWRLSFAVWTNDGRPVAYAILSRKGPCRVHLHHFMVAKSLRGQGIGGSMFEEIERRARAAGCRRLSVKVAPDNARARRFYEGRGFKAGELAGDCLEMAKAL